MIMNHFSYDVFRKEKIHNLQTEGMSSQAFSRSGASKRGGLHGLPKLILTLLGILGILAMLVR
jgi:hypothetical protein